MKWLQWKEVRQNVDELNTLESKPRNVAVIPNTECSGEKKFNTQFLF